MYLTGVQGCMSEERAQGPGRNGPLVKELTAAQWAVAKVYSLRSVFHGVVNTGNVVSIIISNAIYIDLDARGVGVPAISDNGELPGIGSYSSRDFTANP